VGHLGSPSWVSSFTKVYLPTPSLDLPPFPIMPHSCRVKRASCYSLWKSFSFHRGHTSDIISCQVFPTVPASVASCSNMELIVWDNETHDVAKKWNTASLTSSITCSSCIGKDLIAVGTAEGLILVVNTGASGDFYSPIIMKGHGSEVVALSYCNAANLLASSSVDSSVCIWDVSDDRYSLVCKLSGHTGCVSSVQLSVDGSTCISGGAGGKIIVWDVYSKSIKSHLKKHKGDYRIHVVKLLV
jgi:WD40 repeat protein